MNAKNTSTKTNLSCLWAHASDKRFDGQVSVSTLEHFRRELAVAPMARGSRWSELKATLQSLKHHAR